MLFHTRCTIHNYIIQVYEEYVPLEALKDHLHASLESTRSIAETKRELGVLEQTIFGDEGCLGLVFFSNF
jgi:hypothetical protein